MLKVISVEKVGKVRLKAAGLFYHEGVVYLVSNCNFKKLVVVIVVVVLSFFLSYN